MKRVLVGLLILLAIPLAGCSALYPDGSGSSEFESEDHVYNAQAYYEDADYGRAYHQFQKALSIDEDNEKALLGRAWCLLLIGEGQIMRLDREGPENVQVARDLLMELEDEDLGPNDYKVDLGLGKAHQLLSDLYGRRAALIRSEGERRTLTSDRDAALRQAEMSYQREVAAAERHLARVLSSAEEGAGDDLTALVILAKFSADRGNYADTILYCERFLEQIRRSKNLWVDAIERYPEDEALWEAKLAGAVTKEIPTRYVISNAFFKIGKIDLAKEQLDQILLLNPELTTAYLDRGVVHQLQGKKLEAIEDYKDFLRGAARYGLPASEPRVIEAAARIEELEKELYEAPESEVETVDEP